MLTDVDAESGVILPAEAVQSVDGRDVVFVTKEAGHFTARPVAVDPVNETMSTLGSDDNIAPTA